MHSEKRFRNNGIHISNVTVLCYNTSYFVYTLVCAGSRFRSRVMSYRLSELGNVKEVDVIDELLAFVSHFALSVPKDRLSKVLLDFYDDEDFERAAKCLEKFWIMPEMFPADFPDSKMRRISWIIETCRGMKNADTPWYFFHNKKKPRFIVANLSRLPTMECFVDAKDKVDKETQEDVQSVKCLDKVTQADQFPVDDREEDHVNQAESKAVIEELSSRVDLLCDKVQLFLAKTNSFKTRNRSPELDLPPSSSGSSVENSPNKRCKRAYKRRG